MKVIEVQGSLCYETLYVVMRQLGFDKEQIENTIKECRKHETDNQ